MKIFFAVVAMGLCACAGANAPTPSPVPARIPSPTPGSYPGAVITLSAHGGIAGRNDRWTIYPDGRVVTIKNETLRADPAMTAALFAAVEKIQFFSLPDFGHAEPLRCADCIAVTISVATAAKTHSITTYEVTQNVPPEYKALQNMALELVKPKGGSNTSHRADQSTSSPA